MSEDGRASSPLHEERSFAPLSVTEDDDVKMSDAHQSQESPGKSGGRGKSRPSLASQSLMNTTIGKIRHLKKEDGEPLWRKDIQYDFLKAVFDNERKVFTNSYESKEKQCFADLYVDTMSRSSKTSKVLRDKLLSDREAAKGMAMVCLLVNIGRMNTTLNFFPEMRAQLRTYHAIPSLQAHQDPHAYKQLQDAPRLKSILKGGAEDRSEPSSLEKIKAANIPRTNPVNLIFVICQSAPKIAELHFPPGIEFHDLVMKTVMSSESRAKAFLWLMWFYLESDFTEEGCEENPFGAGIDYGVDVANQGVPTMIEMSKEEEAQENVDPQEEIEFGRTKQKMRTKIIEADLAAMSSVDTQVKRGRARHTGTDDGVSATSLPRIRPSKHESDMESTRSTPPPRTLARSTAAGSTRRGAGLKYQLFEASSPAGTGSHFIEGIVARKPRPPTAHQLAVERNRNQRVEYILDRGLRKKHSVMSRQRKREGAIIRAIKRTRAMTDPFEDSEGEEFKLHGSDLGKFRAKGFGGLIQTVEEVDDFGEETSAYAAALRRANRRLTRWESHTGSDLGVIQPVKKDKPAQPDEMDVEDGLKNDDHDHYHDMGNESTFLVANSEKLSTPTIAKTNGHTNGDVHAEDVEDLDDMEKELLGLAPSSGLKSDEMDVDLTVMALADGDGDSDMD